MASSRPTSAWWWLPRAGSAGVSPAHGVVLMPTPSGDTDGAEDNRSKSNDLDDQDEAPTTVRVPVRLDLLSTGLQLIEIPVVARGANDRGSDRA